LTTIVQQRRRLLKQSQKSFIFIDRPKYLSIQK
jgi:hypothetical protein